MSGWHAKGAAGLKALGALEPGWGGAGLGAMAQGSKEGAWSGEILHREVQGREFHLPGQRDTEPRTAPEVSIPVGWARGQGAGAAACPSTQTRAPGCSRNLFPICFPQEGYFWETPGRQEECTG